MAEKKDASVGKEKGEESLREKMEKGYAQARSKAAPAGEEKEEEKYIDTYTVQKGDTLSGIALRYYDSPARDKWMAIYEANKEVIGEDPGMIYPGQEFKIPRLED